MRDEIIKYHYRACCNMHNILAEIYLGPWGIKAPMERVDLSCEVNPIDEAVIQQIREEVHKELAEHGLISGI